MVKKILGILALVLALICMVTSCDNNDNTSDSVSTSDNSTHTHSYGDWETAKSATCTAEGTKARYCSCGEMQTATIPVIEHSYGEWKTTKEATSSEKGTETRECACGKTETRDIDILPIVTTMTQTEWRKAFDFSNYTSITVLGTESGSEDGVDFNFDATIKYYAGLVYISLSGMDYSGNDSFVNYETTTLEDFYAFNTLGFNELQHLMRDFEELSDFGFSKMTYSDSDKSYQTINEYGCIYKFWFENGKLAKYSYEDNGQGENLFCTYTFTAVNSTERFNIPTQSIKDEYQKIVNSITSDTKFYYYDDSWNRVYVSADEMKILLSAMKIEIIDAYEKGLSNGNIKNFCIETSTMSSADKPLTLEMRDGQIYEIQIGYSYDDSVYYYVEN